jgi:plasmid maintenance system antidote protein VapI
MMLDATMLQPASLMWNTTATNATSGCIGYQEIHMRTLMSQMRTFGDLLDARGITMDAVAVLGGVDTATVSRICSGQARATPQTIVRLARALGVNARRMAKLCDQAWLDREARITSEKTEALRQVDIDAIAGVR